MINVGKKLLVVLTLLMYIMGYAGAQILDKTVATVSLYKTESITRQKISKQIKLWEDATKTRISSEEKSAILDAMIDQILISQAADKAGIIATNQQINEAINTQKTLLGTPISDEDFKELIRNQGVEWDEYRNQIRDTIIQEQYIYKIYGDEVNNYPKPTDSDVREAYSLYATRFTNPEMVRISQIFWSTDKYGISEAKSKAEKAASDIGGRAQKFEEYLDNSLDDATYDGGDLGYLYRDESTYRILGQTFLDTVFTYGKGYISGVLQSNLGFHVVRITDKRPPKLLALDDPIFPGESVRVKDRLLEVLSQQKQRQHVLDLVAKEVKVLRKKSRINIIDKNF